MAAARHLTLSIAPDLPTIVADPARVELVLLNVISNAIKYSNAARTDSLVEVLQIAESGGADDATCVIGVRDNGLGIPAAELPTNFDRFSRAHAHLGRRVGQHRHGSGSRHRPRLCPGARRVDPLRVGERARHHVLHHAAPQPARKHADRRLTTGWPRASR
jgi:hypothetical protein